MKRRERIEKKYILVGVMEGNFPKPKKDIKLQIKTYKLQTGRIITILLLGTSQ